MMIDVTSMTFQWPTMLWLLVLVPAFVALYLWLLGRSRKLARRYANLALGGGQPAGAGARIRRHIPAALLLVGLAALLFAVSRPQAPVTVPARQETVILAMDVSGSM